MSLSYKKSHCENCEREQSGAASNIQWNILALLIILFLIPGIIYYYVAAPSRCRICGLKSKHQKK